MRKVLWVLLLLLLLPVEAGADFSVASDTFDPELAQYALQIAETCYMPTMQEAVLAIGGYRRVGVYHQNHRGEDEGHVAMYAVYDRQTEDGRTEVIITIRGTSAGEWRLNLDLMPSGDYTLPYAENFFLAAEDILTGQREYLASLESPVFLITGHSRGAAVANVLAARLTDQYGADNVYGYTFATPRTVRGEYPSYQNIWNVINSADIITYLPFPAWGFQRYGVDVELPVEDTAMLSLAVKAYEERSDGMGEMGGAVTLLGNVSDAKTLISAMERLAAEPEEGYTVRHAFAHPGAAAEDEEGATASAFLQALFEGPLFSPMTGSEALAQWTQAENDFTPLLETLRSLSGTGNSAWIAMMHLPATYGAWLSAMAQRQSAGN